MCRICAPHHLISNLRSYVTFVGILEGKPQCLASWGHWRNWEQLSLYLVSPREHFHREMFEGNRKREEAEKV